MSRRIARNEVGFESDSFLDIIANIVGILIILIVLAGVRVSQSPVLPILDVAASEPVEQAPPIVVIGPIKSEEAQLPAPPGPEATPPQPEPPPQPSPKLIAIVQNLKQELAALKSHTLSTDQSLDQLALAKQTTDKQLSAIAAALSKENAAFDAEHREVTELQAKLLERRDRARRSRFQLTKAKRDRPPAKQIRHKLTPLGRTVVGKEIHFYLARNRVAVVPLDDLLGRLRKQVIRQRGWLTKFNSHQGSVGPFRGFTMNYVVVRQQLSVVEELRQGGSVMRIGVSEWQLIPDTNLEAETAAEALRTGSAFHRALLSVDREATLTFWVYPDSFGIYRKLQQVAHEEGFTVAARPLPTGIPISGSPNGSRSSGQ